MCGHNQFFFYCCSCTADSIFTPPRSPHPTHLYLPPLKLPPLALSMCPLYMFLDDPSPSLLHYPPLPSPLVTVNLSFISMFLALFCSIICFVDQVPVRGEIIWYFSFCMAKENSIFCFLPIRRGWTKNVCILQFVF